MNTQSSDQRLQAIQMDQVRVEEATCDDMEKGVTELGKVSDTAGGILGFKYDSGYGWQIY